MKTVYVMIGPPASGKSSISYKIWGKYLSADEIREELYGDAGIQGDPAEV